MSAQHYVIGRWRFDPREPVLQANDEQRRLEDRAARTLELLCRRRGEVIAKQELIEAVWQGRSVSPNSVAVVIGDLRRALEDDPRAPFHILTVNKRGYRLSKSTTTADPAIAPANGGARRRIIMITTTIAAATALAVGAVMSRSSPPPVELYVEPVVNETGRPELNVLTLSLDSVVVDGAARLGVQVVPGKARTSIAGGHRLALRSRLILWNEAPELAMTAVDVGTGGVIWSGFAAGPPDALARHTTARMQTLRSILPR